MTYDAQVNGSARDIISLVGAMYAGRAARFIGTGHAIVLGNFLWALGVLVIPLAGLTGTILFFVGAGQIVAHIGAAVWSVNQMSLRQVLTPVGLFGRVTAARQFLMFSLQIGGAAMGGFLGSEIGLRATLAIGAVGLGASFLLVFFSPVRGVRNLSDVTANP